MIIWEVEDLVNVEALIFRNDLRDISPLQIHDDNFSHLSGNGYYHEETEEGTIIIFGEVKPYCIQHISFAIKDEKTEKLVEEFVEEECFEMDEVSVVINENCSSNILFCYEYGIDFSENFEDEYATYYDKEKQKVTGYVFLSEDDANLFEEIQELQEAFAKENGLDVDFINNSEYEVKIKELEQEVNEYIEERF